MSEEDLFLPMIFHLSKVFFFFGPKGHLIRQLLPLIRVDGGIVAEYLASTSRSISISIAASKSACKPFSKIQITIIK